MKTKIKKRFGLDRKIYIIFFVIITISVINAVVSSWVAITNRDRNEYISSVVSPSLEALHQLHIITLTSRNYITNWVYLQNSRSGPEQALMLNEKEYQQIKNKLVYLSSQWHKPHLQSELFAVFAAYEKLGESQEKVMKLLAAFDDYNDPSKKFSAEEILESQIIPIAESIVTRLQSIVLDKQLETSIAQNNLKITLSALLVAVVGLSSLIIVSILAVFLFMSSSILGPMMNMREVILKMSRGEFPNLNFRVPKNAVGETIDALSLLLGNMKRTAEFARKVGNGDFDSTFEPLSENDVQGKALLEMRTHLKTIYKTEMSRNWVAEGLANITADIHKNSDSIEKLISDFSMILSRYIGVSQTAVFLSEKDEAGQVTLKKTGSFHMNELENYNYKPGEGLVGQCFLSAEKIRISSPDSKTFLAKSGLLEISPYEVVFLPLVASGRKLGVLEIVLFEEISEQAYELLLRITEPLAMALFGVQTNIMTRKLLEETLKQAQELENQKQELRCVNDDLLKKSKELGLSQEELEKQQEELKQMNLELEMKAHLLQEQNISIENARQALSIKAQELEKGSKYKSDFLANMSHELRTPLNSVLILARILSENKSGNLTNKQIEHAKVIHKSGSDLLLLINEILDLSKIEAGRMEMNVEKVPLDELIADQQALFSVMAADKKIQFKIEKEQGLPESIGTDKIRLEQILKNLLSNAIKFTPAEGKVTLKIELASRDSIYNNENLYKAESVIAFHVSDTGIGIPEDKQKIVFEAFKQADGSTSRKFGGTGLGLTISRELSRLLEGELSLYSVEGSGSTFSLFLPCCKERIKQLQKGHSEPYETKSNHDKPHNPIDPAEYSPSEIPDDRNNISQGDCTVLIIEDDIPFLRILTDTAHEAGYKVISAIQGDRGLDLASHFKPDKIILDLQLPVMDGWNVLKKLKSDPAIRSIPVYIISALNKKPLAMQMGASGYILKPASKEDIVTIFNHMAKAEVVQTAVEADANSTSHHAGNQLYSGSSETSPPVLDALSHALKGKKVLLADDDMRNIYSLSAVLSAEGMEVITVFDGKQAVDSLLSGTHADIVLMDIMMPVMDGYTAIQEIRNHTDFRNLPIIALTAQAMKEDRQKCLDAGASDYMAKPINTEHLLSLMGAWLFK